MIAECYDLSVQCDNKMHILPVRSSFTGMRRSSCWKDAKSAGWLLSKDGGAKCPACGKGGTLSHKFAVK